MTPPPRWLDWLRGATPHERRTLLAGSLGWLLDSFDVMLYALVLTHLIAHFGMDKTPAGFLNSLTLFASALGGALFGFLADRVGRTRALMGSILVYSLASGGGGLVQRLGPRAALFRVTWGVGMGGEWTPGAAVVAESWRAEHRGKALGLMQSSWAIGEGLAAGTAGVVLGLGTGGLPHGWEVPAWRAVFLVGGLPALLVFWVRRRVGEPAIWRERKLERVPLRRLWQPDVR